MPSSVEFNGVNATIECNDALGIVNNLPAASVDLLFTSPPYCIGKEYDKSFTSEDFLIEHMRLLQAIVEKVKIGGSICWQVGFHVSGGVIVPLDSLVYHASLQFTSLKLRNRIIWTFAHGTHASKRFSGRYETVMWFTKGDITRFDLDAVRVPQKYPGKRFYKGPRKGEWSGNPLGKNPGDVWEIPNVKSKHPEKTEHPCQFPTALARRFIRALTAEGDLVIDPYLGSGTTAVAALMEGRNFIGGDISPAYFGIANRRLADLSNGNLKFREDIPPREPKSGESVSITPPHFRQHEKSESFQ